MDPMSTSIIPPELTGPVPRRIRPSAEARIGMVIMALMCGLALFGCIWLCAHAAQQIQHRTALRQNGAEVQAHITFLGRVGRGSDIVRYTFTANGETVSGKSDVPPELMMGLRESSLLPIRHLPSNPAVNHPAAWEWSLLSNWLTILPPIAYGSIWTLALMGVFRLRQLIAQGLPAGAVVTECSPNGGSFSVKYEFRTETGTPVQGGGNCRTRQEIGTFICIVYLPGNPRRNRPYPNVDFIVEQ